MKNINKVFPFFVMLCFVSSSNLLAQNNDKLPKKEIDGFRITTDQDVFSPFNQDKNYTMGIQFTWMGQGVNKWWLGSPMALHGLDYVFIDLITPNLDRNCLANTTFTFGGAAFTPDSLKYSRIVTNDRPYSFPIFLTSNRVYLANEESRTAITTSFSFLFLGTHIARNVQSAIHYLQASKDSNNAPIPNTSSAIPRGWSNQIGNNGAVSFNYQYHYLYKLFDENISKFKYLGSIDLGGSAGIYTNASVGLNLMFGFFDRKWYQPVNSVTFDKKKKDQLEKMKKNTESVQLSELDPNPARQASYQHKCEFFFKANATGYGWLNNGLLDGTMILGGTQVFNTRKSISEVELQRLTYELFIGAELRINYFVLSGGFKYRSAELAYVVPQNQSFPGYSWGQISFGWML